MVPASELGGVDPTILAAMSSIISRQPITDALTLVQTVDALLSALAEQEPLKRANTTPEAYAILAAIGANLRADASTALRQLRWLTDSMTRLSVLRNPALDEGRHLSALSIGAITSGRTRAGVTSLQTGIKVTPAQLAALAALLREAGL